MTKTFTWMFSYVLLKFPPGVYKHLAVSMRAAVTCRNHTSPNECTDTSLHPVRNCLGLYYACHFFLIDLILGCNERLHANAATTQCLMK